MKINTSRKLLRVTWHVFFLALLTFTSFTIAFAQSGNPPTDDEVNAVAHKLYCPVCENTPLDVCPTDACKDWRELIRTMLAEGKTEDQILQHFKEQYGARVLAEPPKEGFYWLVYILPPAIILVGAFILIRAMREWTKSQATESSPSVTPSPEKDDYVKRLEDELKKQK